MTIHKTAAFLLASADVLGVTAKSSTTTVATTTDFATLVKQSTWQIKFYKDVLYPKASEGNRMPLPPLNERLVAMVKQKPNRLITVTDITVRNKAGSGGVQKGYYSEATLTMLSAQLTCHIRQEEEAVTGAGMAQCKFRGPVQVQRHEAILIWYKFDKKSFESVTHEWYDSKCLLPPSGGLASPSGRSGSGGVLGTFSPPEKCTGSSSTDPWKKGELAELRRQNEKLFSEANKFAGKLTSREWLRGTKHQDIIAVAIYGWLTVIAGVAILTWFWRRFCKPRQNWYDDPERNHANRVLLGREQATQARPDDQTDHRAEEGMVEAARRGWLMQQPLANGRRWAAGLTQEEAKPKKKRRKNDGAFSGVFYEEEGGQGQEAWNDRGMIVDPTEDSRFRSPYARRENRGRVIPFDPRRGTVSATRQHEDGNGRGRTARR